MPRAGRVCSGIWFGRYGRSDTLECRKGRSGIGHYRANRRAATSARYRQGVAAAAGSKEAFAMSTASHPQSGPPPAIAVRMASHETRTTSRPRRPCRTQSILTRRQSAGDNHLDLDLVPRGDVTRQRVRPRSSRSTSSCASQTLSPSVTCPPKRRPLAFHVTLPVFLMRSRSVNDCPDETVAETCS